MAKPNAEPGIQAIWYPPPELLAWLRRQSVTEEITITDLIVRACRNEHDRIQDELRVRDELNRSADAITPAPALDQIRRRTKGTP